MSFLAQLNATETAAFSTESLLFSLIIFVIVAAGWWQMFSKAGTSGWLAFIPIVNVFVYIIAVAKLPWWLGLLLFIPFVNLIVILVIHNAVANNFRQGILFTLGLFFLTPIFVLLLGFGDYRFRG